MLQFSVNDIYFPRYNYTNEIHRKIVELGDKAHQKAKEYLEKNPPKKNYQPRVSEDYE